MFNYWNHQLQAIDKGKDSIGFWMGCRTGKTSAALGTADKHDLYPALIISPLSVIPTWADDYEGIHGTEEGFKAVTTRNDLVCKNSRVFCTNYEKVLKLDPLGIRAESYSFKEKAPKWMGLQDFKSVFIDESYRMANWENKITQYLNHWDKPEYQNRYCLSATPAPEQCYNFATQYIFMRGEFMGCTDILAYLNKYWTYNEDAFQYFLKDPMHIIQVKNYIQEHGYCITMSELGLGTEPYYNKHKFDLNQKQIDLMEHLKHCHIYEHKKTGEETIMIPVTRVIFERKIAAGFHPFTDEIINTNKMEHVLQMFKDKPEHILVASVWNAPLEHMYKMALAAGIPTGYIHGGVKTEERERLRLQFQNGGPMLLFGQTDTIYVGLKFSKLDKLVIYANSYKGEVRMQLEQRGNATERTDPYQIIDLPTRGTIESELCEVLVKKEKEAYFYTKKWAKDIMNRN